ncbi:MAG: Amuc_1100 family pilus-like protein [Verrucomicrobiae bacterium]|nr:Amuc_1100 family pilus-like protein [Verrucomicrobiae bacterium]
MKGSTWLAGYIVLALALIGGAGFFFAKGLGAYNEGFTGWDNLSSRIAKLEKEVPYPSEENEKEFASTVEQYRKDVDALYQSLDRYQKPLETNLSDSNFTTQILAGKVDEFKAFAAEKGMEIKNADQFYMAMEAYQSTFPKPGVVPFLNYQLDAIDHLLRTMAEAGVAKLNFVNREDLPGETEDTGDQPVGIEAGKVVQKYPVNLKFEASHGAFQRFVNQIANDKDYFLVLRLVRVENSNAGGPDLAPSGEQGPVFVDSEGNPVPKDVDDEIRASTSDYSGLVEAFTSRGYQLQKQDARIIFGQETLDVFAVVDLVRFLPPDEVELLGKQSDSGKSKAKKR